MRGENIAFLDGAAEFSVVFNGLCHNHIMYTHPLVISSERSTLWSIAHVHPSIRFKCSQTRAMSNIVVANLYLLVLLSQEHTVINILSSVCKMQDI